MNIRRLPITSMKILLALCIAIMSVLVLVACEVNSEPSSTITTTTQSALSSTTTSTLPGSPTTTITQRTLNSTIASTLPGNHTTTTTQNATTESTPIGEAAFAVTGNWVISHATEKETGSDIPLQEIYGTGISYGGTLSLNQDGTFSKYIGITNGDADAYEGEYSVNVNFVTLEYGNNTVEHAEYLPENDELRILTGNMDHTSIWEYFVRQESNATRDDFDFAVLSGMTFTHSSGAGAWSTQFEIQHDGSFTGRYSDDDMGDRSTDYQNGTRYIWEFSGKFTQPNKSDDDGYMYDLKCESLLPVGDAPGTVKIVDGVRYIATELLGSDIGIADGDYILFLPGTSFHMLPESIIELNGRRTDGAVNPILGFYALYFPFNDVVFVSESEPLRTTNEILLSVYDMDGQVLYMESLNSDQKYLFDFVNGIEDLDMISSDSEAGKFISSIMGISYDYGQYWNCYINGELLSTNIASYEIHNYDVVDFRYEKVG